MNLPTHANRNQYLELLAGRALGDLTSNEALQLQTLVPQFPDIDEDDMDRVVAVVDMSLTPVESVGMPSSVRERIQADAAQFVGNSQDLHAQPEEHATVHRSETRIGLRESFAWFAATACLLLALLGWMSRGKTMQPVALTPAELRSAILDESDHVQVAWSPGKDPFDHKVTGDVVWSSNRQEGYMCFKGLPTNNPSVEQYQLWIIDPSRDDEPVDGGVFDVTKSGEVIVPIRAKLVVSDPKAFAITIEKPGGVVVSAQERLPLLASVGTS